MADEQQIDNAFLQSLLGDIPSDDTDIELQDSEEGNEGTDDIPVEPSQSSFDYPDFMDEAFVPPTEFNSVEDELAWYKENYGKSLVETLKSESFQETLLKEYAEEFAKTEKDFEKIKAIKTAFDKDPETAIKLYFPDALEKRGYRTVIEGDAANNWVANKLADKYGENYAEVYDPTEAQTKPNSVSAKMLKDNQIFLQELEQHNQKARQKEDSTREKSPEEMDEFLAAEYERDFKSWMPKEKFEEFVGKVKETNLSLKQLFDAVYFNEQIAYAREQGKAEGRKEVAQKLKGNVKTVTPTITRQTVSSKEDTVDVSKMNAVERHNYFKTR